MLRTIIVEDDPSLREEIFNKITVHHSDKITIVGQAASVTSAITLIENLKPDLLFLDIKLKGGSGFDIIAQSKYKEFDVIFITGYDHHAIKAIKVGALDYLLKPIGDDELDIAIRKAFLNKGLPKEIGVNVEVSSEYYKGAVKKRIILKTTEHVYAIYEENILYCKADGNYTTFYLQDMPNVVISKPLKYVEEILTKDIFIRCHQSYIVNKTHVIKYSKNGVLIVHQDCKVPVSARRKEYAIKKIFNM